MVENMEEIRIIASESQLVHGPVISMHIAKVFYNFIAIQFLSIDESMRGKGNISSLLQVETPISIYSEVAPKIGGNYLNIPGNEKDYDNSLVFFSCQSFIHREEHYKKIIESVRAINGNSKKKSHWKWVLSDSNGKLIVTEQFYHDKSELDEYCSLYSLRVIEAVELSRILK